MRNTKRVVVALTLTAAALSVAAPASADDGSSGEGRINLPESPGEVVDGVRTGLEVAAMSWELAQARPR
ncbi:hypothetical protein ACWGH2_14645 [Streptomyces sp. NPDC054871]